MWKIILSKLSLLKNIKLSAKDLLYIFIIILLLIGGVSLYFNLKSQHKSEITDVNNLNRALNGEVTFLKNELGEERAEKYVIQTDYKELNKSYNKLNENQQYLLDRINDMDKDNKIIAASLIKLNADLSGISSNDPTEISDSTITFSELNDSIEYKIRVVGVKPYNLVELRPKLYFDVFKLPNTQFIEFHWEDNKKEGYPVSFSVTNSSSFFKTQDIQSYIIPEVSKVDLNPTFWNKLGNFTNKSGVKITIFGAGFAAGYLLSK